LGYGASAWVWGEFALAHGHFVVEEFGINSFIYIVTSCAFIFTQLTLFFFFSLELTLLLIFYFIFFL